MTRPFSDRESRGVLRKALADQAFGRFSEENAVVRDPIPHVLWRLLDQIDGLEEDRERAEMKLAFWALSSVMFEIGQEARARAMFGRPQVGDECECHHDLEEHTWSVTAKDDAQTVDVSDCSVEGCNCQRFVVYYQEES